MMKVKILFFQCMPLVSLLLLGCNSINTEKKIDEDTYHSLILEAEKIKPDYTYATYYFSYWIDQQNPETYEIELKRVIESKEIEVWEETGNEEKLYSLSLQLIYLKASKFYLIYNNYNNNNTTNSFYKTNNGFRQIVSYRNHSNNVVINIEFDRYGYAINEKSSGFIAGRRFWISQTVVYKTI